MANLDLAYGDSISQDEKRAIVLKVFQNFSLTMLDYYWFSRNTAERIRLYVKADASCFPWLNGGPLVAVTAHFGNWEVFGHVAVAAGSGLASVAKPVKNPLIDRRINQYREASGQRIIPREGALKALVRVLREKGTVALLLDQDTRLEDGGVFVPFFGVPVPMSGAAGGLAARMAAPLAIAYCRHQGDGTYFCYIRNVFRPEELKGKDAAEITGMISALLEDEIRRDPSQWLWLYKRWKRRTAGVAPERYPFYADC
jgi:KDO2-lipid IV(A) lauroyltransferase